MAISHHTCTIENSPGGMLKHSILLAKPGIILGNLVSVAGGFFLASRGNVNLTLLLSTMLGISLVMASACVFNNVIDRDIDRKMERTRSRALALGLIAPKTANMYACLLGVPGFVLLAATTNLWAVAMAFMGVVVYLGLYSLYLKRNSVHGTLIGSLSGAAPPLVGYCAVSNNFDLGAVILLLIFSLWQMPHAYAIGIFRLRDYRSAGIPVLPVKMGVEVTRTHIILYVIAFTVANFLLTLAGYVGITYMLVAAVLGAYWLYIACADYRIGGVDRWAKRVFVFSILVVIALSIMMSIDFNMLSSASGWS